MKGNSPHRSQTTLFQNLGDLLNPEDSLYKLSNKLPWEELENLAKGNGSGRVEH